MTERGADKPDETTRKRFRRKRRRDSGDSGGSGKVEWGQLFSLLQTFGGPAALLSGLKKPSGKGVSLKLTRWYIDTKADYLESMLGVEERALERLLELGLGTDLMAGLLRTAVTVAAKVRASGQEDDEDEDHEDDEEEHADEDDEPWGPPSKK